MIKTEEFTGRILALGCCAFVAGAATYVDGSAFGVLLLLVCIGIFACGGSRIETKTWLVPMLFVTLFLLGYLRIYTSDNRAIGTMHALEGQDITAVAIVERESQYGYLLRVVEADCDIMGRPYLETEQELRPGDVVKVQGQCLMYDGAENPGDFSYMNYMKSCGNFFFIQGACQPYADSLMWHHVLLARLCSLFGNIGNSARELIQRLFGEDAPVIMGMILGDTDAMPYGETQMYRQAGIGHYFAVSGLHIGMLAGGISWAFGLIGLGKKGKAIAVMVSVTVLLALCGFTPSSLRAAFMLLMSAVAYLVYRRSDVVTTVSLSAAVSLCLTPHLIYNSGFILSHGAIISFGIINAKLVSPLIKMAGQRHQKVLETLAAPLVFWLVTAPASGSMFGSVATYGVLSNLVCSGLFSLAFGLGLASLAVGAMWFDAGQVLARSCSAVISLVRNICSWITSLPNPEITGISASFLLYALLLLPALGIGLAHSSRHRQRGPSTTRCIRALLTAPVAICALIALAQAATTPLVQATYLSVGQGDSTVLQFANGATMVVDGSTEYYGDRLLDYLERRGVEHVDALVLSHGHSDHGGGLLGVMGLVQRGQLSLGRLYLSGADETGLARALADAAATAGVDVAWLHAGDSFQVGGNRVDVMWPVAGHSSLKEENNYSLVLALEVGQDRFIFTGDIESNAESFIIDYMDPCSVLKVAHHGSNTSSTAPFLEVLSPEISLISVGNNTYGHPAPQVVDRLTDVGSLVHITRRDGALIVRSDGRGCKIVNWKGLWGLRN